MEKKFWALIGVLLVFSFIFMGCDNGGEEDQTTKFEGTWVNPLGSQNAYTFTGNNWSRTNNNNNQNVNGTFTFTETTITFVPTSGNSWTQGYTFFDTTLSFIEIGGVPFGTFTKQAPTKFEGTWVKDDDANVKYVFTNNEWKLTGRQDRSDNIGLFTYTDTIITMVVNPSLSNGSTGTINYSYTTDGNILTFTGSGDGPAQSTGSFTKQP
jgi:hypothetical protein